MSKSGTSSAPWAILLYRVRSSIIVVGMVLSVVKVPVQHAPSGLDSAFVGLLDSQVKSNTVRALAMSNSDVITAFCEVWAEKDVDRIMEFFNEDAVYHNIPMDPANVGKDQIRAVIEMFTTAPESVEFAVHHQAENTDGIVMNERTDTFRIGDTVIQLRVMGTFELAGGKISAWRDYFDMAQLMKAMG